MGNYGNSKSKAVLVGLALAWLGMLLCSLLASAVVYFAPFTDLVLGKLGLALEGLCLCVGGYAAGRLSGTRGLALGLLVGLLSLALLTLLNGAGDHFPLKALVCLAAAGLGGVVGVR